MSEYRTESNVIKFINKQSSIDGVFKDIQNLIIYTSHKDKNKLINELNKNNINYGHIFSFGNMMFSGKYSSKECKKISELSSVLSIYFDGQIKTCKI